MKSIKVRFFCMPVGWTLLCAVLSACGGSPAPVSAQAPAGEADAPILVPVSAQSTGPADELDVAIREASTYLNGRVPGNSKAVFLNIKSDYPDLSEYILSVLSENAVNDGVFSVVDRQQLDTLRAELNFQMSGEVSDESAQSIGQMLGAQSIVSGTVSKIGSLYRVQVKAIEVQSAGVQGQWSRNIPNGTTIAALTERYAPAPATSVATASAAASAKNASSGGGTAQAQTPASVVTPAQAQVAVQTPRQVSENDLVGVWKGSYTAGQGETALILSVYEERGAYLAIFDFYNLPGRSNSSEGKYYMQVSYNRSREKFYLKGTEWIERPSGYGFADLEGTITGDVFSGFLTGSNTRFRIVRQDTN
ncbi:MAG: penicillin-binding protein activator LpoB [Treponema sp.]|jgi:hypothetical protein|nr:penicillin-binding protein activator LpoB [Treponema sp.]